MSSLPGIQQLDSIFVQETLGAEKGKDLVAKQQLGCPSIDIRDRVPETVFIPAAT